VGIWEAYRMAIKSILSKKGRSILTMLGVIIGVSAVISAVAFAQGSTKNITSQIQGMGTNLIQINVFGRGSNRSVSSAQLKKFADQNSDTISGIAPQITSTVTVKAGSKSMSTTTMLGTTPEYESIKSRYVQSGGRFLLSYDVDYKQKVALVGTAVVNTLYGGQNPVGKTIKINGEVFNVVGVLEGISSGQASTDDDYIIIPVSVAQRLSKMAAIRNFYVQAANPENVNTVIDKLDAFLLKIYNSSRMFNVVSQEQMLSTLSSVTGSMMMVLGGIAAISLVVGGIGIMNIMLVSVTERTREIGIRKAIGAKRKNILLQFLIEAAMITGIGGLMGILIGVAFIKVIIGGFKLVPEVYSIPWMSVSFGISLVVGVVFGMFPAIKASRLNPIEALRFE